MQTCYPSGMRRTPSAIAIALLTLVASASAFAADITPGTYMLEGGSYTITIDKAGDGLVVHEPNKDSSYTRFDDDEFHFWNDNTQTNYGLRYVDARTIEAFKPDVSDNVPSRLVLMGSSTDAVVESPDSERWEQLAEQYSARIEGDPDNAQAWSACAAVAMKRGISTVADADAYASQMKQMLALMMGEGSASPCPEVIP
jgi:hypothetical protein